VKTFRLPLGRVERELLRELLAELRGLIEAGGDDVARLYPAAHRDDPEAAAEYERLTRSGLTAGRLAALDTVERTLDAPTLDPDELEAWTGVLNDLRLVHGERLSVTEEMDLERLARRDPRYAVYAWLTWLQATMIDELSSLL
jgi:Domain of unknown function (DUF2017)